MLFLKAEKYHPWGDGLSELARFSIVDDDVQAGAGQIFINPNFIVYTYLTY